jgi:hypothetical protein
MVQIIPQQGNIFGRIGHGLGQGIAEQLPKEIERSRLAGGLKDLENQQGLTPFQQFSRLASVPGITPQMIQSGTDLLRQQARGQALSQGTSQQNQPNPSPFPNQTEPNRIGPASKTPSLTKEDILEKVQEGYIPPTIKERDALAGQAYNENPAFFANDPQKALDWADSNIAQEEKIAQAYQNKHSNLTNIQDNVVKRLNDQSERLNTKIPAELYSQIEDKAIQATKPKKDGGQGLTEQQAVKDFGEHMNNASRTFAKVKELGGGWGVTLRSPTESLRAMKKLQSEMEALDQTDNYAKELISQSQLSPTFAYAIAEPVSRVPSVNNFIKSLPGLEKIETLAETKSNPAVAIPKTLEIAPKLANFIKQNEKASPLAIAYEIEKKGYDGKTWLQYIADHPELNLRARQSEQASTPINEIAPWNDWWLSSFTGIE